MIRSKWRARRSVIESTYLDRNNESDLTAYCIKSIGESVAIQPSVFPDSRNTTVPGVVSQTETAGLDGSGYLAWVSEPEADGADIVFF